MAAGCVSAGDEADEMMAAVSDRVTLDAWISRRELGEPLAWIVGTTQFCGRRIAVAPGVYVPRPQTEDLAVRAAAALPATGRAVDLCTGSGAIAAHLTASSPTAFVIGVDVDEAAARCARANGVLTVIADLAAGVRRGRGFDVVTAVAPYVPSDDLAFLPADVQRFEPRRALDGGVDGLALVRRVVTAAAALLRTGGSLFLEIGGEQDDGLDADLGDSGLELTERWYDEDGDLRGLAALRH